MKHSEIDYEGIEKDYRAGILTIREIADKYKINKSTIVNRAKKHSWERDLSSAIKARAKAKIAAIDISATINENVQEIVQSSVQIQKNAIEEAADAVAGIVLKHRKAFADDLERAKRIEDQLEKMMSSAADTKELAAIASTYKIMVEAKAKVMASEAQIFDLYSKSEEESKDGAIDKLLLMVNQQLED